MCINKRNAIKSNWQNEILLSEVHNIDERDDCAGAKCQKRDLISS